MSDHLRLLGLKSRDVVTGFSGVVTSISFDLYGCIQGLVTPEFMDGKQLDSRWFDISRLIALDDEPVMAVPDFARIPGGQELPQYSSQPD
jgi:hypothetical protein